MKDTLDYRKLFSLIFIAGIALVFTLQFGPGANGCAAPLGQIESTSAAVVNGEEIPVQAFAETWARQMNFLRAQGQPITEELARQFGMPKQVLDQMVDAELLAQAAEKHGIVPSDEELAKLIHQNPDFQKDGRFDVDTYRQMLRDYYRKTDVQYETELRRQLAAQMMLETVANSAAVSDDEVKARFQKEGNRANVTYVRFTPTMFVDQVKDPTPEELASYKQAKAKEIEASYNANKYLYSQPAQVRARHILIKGEGAKEKVENLRKEIVDGGKDFAEMAKQFSEDPGSKEKGGDLGFNTSDAWVKPFSDAAFALKEGEVSQPVESEFGVHLIKVEEKKPPMNKPLEEVSGEIATQMWKKEKAKDLAKAEAEKALAELKAGKDLKALYPAEEKQEGVLSFQAPKKPEAGETGEFNASVESIPRIGPAPELLPEVFARTTPGVLDRVYPIGDGFVVANVTSRQLPSDAEYEQKKEELRAEARRAKEFELRDQFIKSLRESGKVVVNDAAIDQVLGPAT
ncbi:MAG: SurA N-terminal domain-containing protein [Myxococcaceae bacterium]